MVWIVDGFAMRIVECRTSFIECDAMLPGVRGRLGEIPFKANEHEIRAAAGNSSRLRYSWKNNPSLSYPCRPSISWVFPAPSKSEKRLLHTIADRNEVLFRLRSVIAILSIAIPLLRDVRILLLNTAGVWQQSSLEQKQRLQQVLFPAGVEYENGVYRTQETTFLFKSLGQNITVEEMNGSATGNRTRV